MKRPAVTYYSPSAPTARQRLCQRYLFACLLVEDGVAEVDVSSSIVLLLVCILGSNGLRDVLPHGVVEGITVLGGVGILQGALHSVPPALGVVSLEAALNPRLRLLELEALYEFLGHLGLDGVDAEHLGDGSVNPAPHLLPVDLLALLGEDLFGRDDLGFDPQFL